ncbi:MAG: T9SS type A sorting domain-containing protein [Flavobacteriales bacterium]|nr:T9SS type A sorting domain-containing protein [Flavobacteriales bacterium]
MRSLLIPVLAMAHVASAQPPVLYSSMPQTATTYLLLHGDSDYASDFLSVANYWDIPEEALTTPGTAYWGPSAGSAYDDEFPNANWLLKTPNGSTNRYRYYAVSPGEIMLVGEVVFGNISIYTIPRSILFFPMYLNYQSFGGYQIEGQPVSSYFYSYASYGDLYLGQWSFSDVIRIIDYDHLTFWNSDPLYPIVMMDTEDAPFDWVAMLPGQVGMDDPGHGTLSFTPYPNPSSGLVHVDRLPSEVSYSVIDPVGRVVLTGTRSNDLIDLGSLPAGSYQLLLNSPVSTRAVPLMKVDRGGE